jgi:predicted nucleotide-binding protein
MPTKKRIIAELTRDELWGIVDDHELLVEDRRRLDHLQTAVRRLTRTELREILLALDRDRLKQICRHLNLDDSGKIKADIVDRLILVHNEELDTDDLEELSSSEQVANQGLQENHSGKRPSSGGDDQSADLPRPAGVRQVVSRPTLFIGSTVEALAIARAVHAELDYDLDVTIWNHGLFPPGVTTWAQLTQTTHNYDFALFIFSGDDEVFSRGEQSIAIRDNLLIEYGLFVGVLGARRTFFLYNRDQRPKIATDLGGVTPLTYRDRPDNNFRSAVSPACDEIRQIVARLGTVPR